VRRLLIDLTPMRRSRDYRHLVWGELVSVLGTQLTTVAVPYQVYQLTRSSLAVGLVSITQLFPLIAGSLLGGSVVDAMDRRRLLMIAQVLMAACSAGLAVNADLGTALWPLFVLPALAAGFSGLDSAGRNAMVPNLVRRSEVSTANSIFQALWHGAGAVPGAGGFGVRRRRVDARLPVRRARRGRAGGRAHHRLGFADSAAGSRGHHRGDRVGRRDHVFRPGALAAPGPAAPGRGGLRYPDSDVSGWIPSTMRRRRLPTWEPTCEMAQDKKNPGPARTRALSFG
jgi:Transmembrane secretion effector